MLVIGRRNLLLGGAALAAVSVAACGGGGGGAGSISPDDMVLGDTDAPVTLIEYGSVMCGHCAQFHAAVWEQLKANYIDTGKVRFVFREILSPAQPEIIPVIALAGFQVARCGNASPEQYFNRVGVLMHQQPAIFAAGSIEGVRAKFIEIGDAAGLSQEQVLACIADPTGGERADRISRAAGSSVTGTPTFFINGEKVEDPSVMTYEGISRLLDAAIAAAA
ncbi:MAG: DsbA family protein [Hyphomonadaceae bacterium]